MGQKCYHHYHHHYSGPSKDITVESIDMLAPNTENSAEIGRSTTGQPEGREVKCFRDDGRTGRKNFFKSCVLRVYYQGPAESARLDEKLTGQ